MKLLAGNAAIGLTLFLAAGTAAIAIAQPPAGSHAGGASRGLAVSKRVSYRSDVLPILSAKCFSCHGPDDAARKAGLRLDTPAALKPAASGFAAIIPGNPLTSGVIKRITLKSGALQMPPAETGHPLTSKEIQTITEWIKSGAKYEQHWAFIAPKRPSMPTSQLGTAWSAHPVDAFVYAGMSRFGLKPSPDTDKRTLLRRAALDLTGIPPTPDEMKAFVADTRPDAYARQVDRLLVSPAYGEHWARVWMDLARYADSKGYEKDLGRSIWRWRDWVTDAYNADIPYDRFSMLQLAGDLLPDASEEDKIATAFHRNTPTNDEGGTDDEEFRTIAVKDRVDTTGQVWMGLTFGCAKCHTHKYDPITQTDYYRFYAIWNQTEDADRYDDGPTLSGPTASQKTELARLDATRKALSSEIHSGDSARTAAFRTWSDAQSTQGVWRRIVPSGVTTTNGAKTTQRPDRSIVVSGPHARTEAFTLTLPLQQQTAAIRLDILKDKSLPNMGPGRAGHDQNIVTSEVVLQEKTADGTLLPVRIVAAKADIEQGGWPADDAFDGKPSSGWAFSPENNKQHAIVFDLERSVSAGSQLVVKLEFNHPELSVGCFALSTASTRQTAKTVQQPGIAELLLVPDAERTAEMQEFIDTAFLSTYQEGAPFLTRLNQIKADEKALRENFPNTPIMRELNTKSARVTKLHNRGSFLDQGAVVTAALPGMFGQPAVANPSRLDAAKWLFSPENPLTARVAVNRIWGRIFGRGLVETEEDFGTQGAQPSHPELLDYLSISYRDDLKYSQKALLKMLVTSRTYKQSALRSQTARRVDPENRWLSGMPRVRLSAEVIRDQALAVSGLLATKMGGPPVMPPQPPGIWKTPYSGMQWVTSTGDDRYRRGLYTYWRRSNPYPSMLTFDTGQGDVCTMRRIRTNTPLQALVTMNDPVYVEAAGALAAGALNIPMDARGRIQWMFERATGRRASDADIQPLKRLLTNALHQYRGAGVEKAKALLGGANANVSKSEDPGMHAALTVVANAILNLDEVLMRP
jgi:hypothetical protein